MRDPAANALAADDSAAIAAFAANTWDEQIVPALTDYIAIPAKEPDVRRRLAAQRPHRARGA